MWFRRNLDVTTPFGEHDSSPTHPLHEWSNMGGGLYVITLFGEHDPPPPTDERLLAFNLTFAGSRLVLWPHATFICTREFPKDNVWF